MYMIFVCFMALTTHQLMQTYARLSAPALCPMHSCIALMGATIQPTPESPFLHVIGKSSLLLWGTFVVLSVYTNYKKYRAAKPGSEAQTKAKWAFIRESLWLVCIINWVSS